MRTIREYKDGGLQSLAKKEKNKMYPENDRQFEDAIISAVHHVKGSDYEITKKDGWSLFIKDSPIEPKEGMAIRTYGRGIGSLIRGIFIEDHKVFYRTEEEDKIYQDKMMYGENAEDWLKRWDDGQTVWTIEMGGLGPGYEQAIHVACAEILRHLLQEQYNSSMWYSLDGTTTEDWEKDKEQIDEASFKSETISRLGLSGAQYGAAKQLAVYLYMKGPISLMKEEVAEKRKIQVSKYFPS